MIAPIPAWTTIAASSIDSCVAKTQRTSLIFCSTFHEQTMASAVQMAALRTRDHCLRSPLVSAVLAFVSGRRGIAHGARSPCGPHHDLALGAALFTRTAQKVPGGIETRQRRLEGG